MLELQRTVGNRATVELLQRQPDAHGAAATADKRLDDVEKRQKILEKRQAASEQDRTAQSKFNKRLMSYQQAAARIAAGFDTATMNFSTAQIAQAQSDALAAQLLGAAVAIGFAASFEWFFAGALGAVGKEAAAAKSTIEAIENPANALISSAVNVGGVVTATRSAKEGQVPAGPTQGGPVAYLARNLEAIAQHQTAFEDAFQKRKDQLGQGSDEAWEKFVPAQQQAIYDAAFNKLDAAGANVDKLPGESQIAIVVERHLWALWIKANAMVSMRREPDDPDKPRPMPKQGEAKAEDISEMRLAIGAEREKRLNTLDIGSRANVTLTGHWYSPNKPDNWRDLLWVWATNHKESIEKAG